MRHNRNEFGAPEPSETATAMKDKLRFHSVSGDLRSRTPDIRQCGTGRKGVLIDYKTRWRVCHVRGGARHARITLTNQRVLADDHPEALADDHPEAVGTAD
jgi:hypothetical protein